MLCQGSAPQHLHVDTQPAQHIDSGCKAEVVYLGANENTAQVHIYVPIPITDADVLERSPKCAGS